MVFSFTYFFSVVWGVSRFVVVSRVFACCLYLFCEFQVFVYVGCFCLFEFNVFCCCVVLCFFIYLLHYSFLSFFHVLYMFFMFVVGVCFYQVLFYLVCFLFVTSLVFSSYSILVCLVFVWYLIWVFSVVCSVVCFCVVHLFVFFVCVASEYIFV